LPNKGQNYTPEFRADAVRLYRSSDRPLGEIAADLGISKESLRRWSKQQDIDQGLREGVTSNEREEIARLRKEVRVLREERDILKRATLQSMDQRNSFPNVSAGVA
jgi:transposase